MKFQSFLILILLITACSESASVEFVDPYEGKKFHYRFEIQSGYTATVSYFDHEENQTQLIDTSGVIVSQSFPAQLGGSASAFASSWSDRRDRWILLQIYLDDELVDEVEHILSDKPPGAVLIYHFD